MYKKELKVLDNLFEYNGVTNIMTGRDYSQHLLWMNEYLADIDNLLADADLQTIDHHNFTDEIEYSNNFLIALLDYAKDISSFVLLLLDNPFKDNLMDNAVDKINDVDINSYSTANTLDIKRLDYCDSGTYYTSIGSVTFQDFIVGNAAYVVPDEFKGFTTQFSNYYENVKTNLNGLSEEEFLYGLLNKDTPEMELKKFVSAVLDITIIKPLIETFTGEDLITGQELSDMERGIKFAGAVVGIITLGTSGILKVPLEQAAQQLGRTLLIDAAATSASYATGIICEKLDLPVPLTVVLCIAVGTAVSITLNGIEYKNVNIEADDVNVKPNAEVEVPSEATNANLDIQRSIIDDVESGIIDLGNNMQKGNYGEMKMDAYFAERGYERISIDTVTDLNAPTHQGIDGVYYNPDGNPPYIVAEAKYNSARLNNTQSGRQMSDSWINGGRQGDSLSRLEASVGIDKADDILIEGYGRRLIRVDTSGNVSESILDASGYVVK